MFCWLFYGHPCFCIMLCISISKIYSGISIAFELQPWSLNIGKLGSSLANQNQFPADWIKWNPIKTPSGPGSGHTQRHVRSNVQRFRTIQINEGTKQSNTKSLLNRLNMLYLTFSNAFQIFLEFPPTHCRGLPDVQPVKRSHTVPWNFLGHPYAIWASKTLYQPSSRTHLES